MIKKVVSLCALSLAALFWSGCDRTPSSGEKQTGPSPGREEPSAERKETEAWRARLNLAIAGATREKGNDGEYVKALNDVATLYAEGLQKGWVHPLDVRSWCDSVAEGGSGYSGETVIGAMFLYGTGVKRDAGAAREWFEYGLARPGIQRGNALYMLGMMYFKGDGVDQDANKAMEMWFKASDEGHPASMGLLGRAYMEGKMGREKDVASGLDLLEKAANGGNIPSSVYLGNLYAKGQEVPQDMKRAMKWYEQAATAGDAHSQYIVGLAYLDGSGVPVDEGKAFNWLRLSAGQDHVNAMLMLSVCYSTGKGSPQNADLAEVWKNKALQLNEERKSESTRRTPQP